VPATSQPTTTQAAARPIAAIWFVDGMVLPPPPPALAESQKLLVGVWSDGTVVWSKNDQARGGRPYQSAHITPAEVETLKNDLVAMHFFDDPEVKKQPYLVPPDAGHIEIGAGFDDNVMLIATWREPPDGNASFQKLYAAAKKRLLATIPAEGKPVEKIDERVFRIGQRARPF
jgi:hypothetical protein